MSQDAKFLVEVKLGEKAFRVPAEVTKSVKGVISRKMLSRMKKEFVNCPVTTSAVPFLLCFTCPSFLRRVKGMVHCLGQEGPQLGDKG